MDDRPLLSDDDSRFPQYFRLYWNELSRLINPQASRDILKDLANILEEDTKDDWFAFAFNVLTNPARMVAELVSKEKNLGLKNPTKEERQEKLVQMTDLMYEKTLQTFTYEVMFNPQTIAYLDEHNKNHDPQLWKDTHLYGYSKNDVSVQTFFKHFYPEEDPEMLDSLVYTFMNLDKVCDLDAKLFEKSLCSDDDKYVEDRARRFFRELPKCGKFDNIWFYELIRTMVHGEHMAALSVLLPNWDLTLKQKEQEAQNVRNQDRNIHLEEEADLEHILVLRPPADFRGALDKIDPEDDPLNQLVLRDYQEELVEHARRGENAIVVAPTGAGKTEVCIYVAREHIDRREREGKASRVVMLVPKIPLVQQQEERFRNYLRHRRLITGLHGAMNLTGTQKHDIFMKADITIMTPEILSNLLRSGRKAEKVYLADISLLIFDEIHHCNQNHVYNRIMQYIHDYTRIPEEQKPQILGLTATPLPKNQTEERNALEEIYKLMANANCYQLSTVVNNIESLERTVAKPDEVFVKENRHEKNAYEEQLKLVVGTILKKIDPDLKALVKVGKTSGFFLTQQEASPKYVGSPGKFTAQLNALKDKLSKLTSTIGDKNKLLIAIDYLLICSKALAINELMPCYFANEFLEKEIGNTQNFSGNAHTRELFSYYEKEQRNLEKISNEAKPSQNNPLPESKAIVKSLLNQIRTNFEEKPDSRCIIFVQERAMAKRLKEYLAEIRILGSPSKVAFVTSVKGSDGMTVEVQRATLQNFHTGAVQIIVATSVLDEGIDVSACNLIIKYNTSSSAVAKIQRAGRVRAQGGRSIFICLHDGVAESEYQAILTGNMMKKCVKVMKDSGPSQVRSKVDEQKKNLAVNRQHQKKLEEELRQRLQGKQYDILCQTCDKVVCDSDRIRVDGSHHCIVDSGIWNHVGIHVSFKKGAKFVDSEHQVLGSLFCIGPMELKDLGNYWVSDSQPDSRCGTKLGDVYKIAGTYFPVLNASKVKFRQRVSKMEEDQECVLSKNWKNVREQYFYVPNLHDADIRKMLNGLKQSGNALMEHRLEEALKRISAEFNRDISRRKAEFERAERIRSGPKEKFATYNDDDDVYGGSELTGFGDAFDLSLLDEDEEE